MKYTTKLLIFVILLAILIIGLVSILVNFLSSEVLIEREEFSQVENAISIMDKIDRTLYERTVNVKTFSEDRVINSRESSAEEILERLIYFRNEYKIYESLTFFNTDRIVIADTAGVGVGGQHKLSSYWLSFEEKQNSFMSVGLSEALGKTVLFFVSPVEDLNGEVFGVLVARVPIGLLYNLTVSSLLEFSVEKNRIDLVDGDNLVLYSNYNRANILKDEYEHIEHFSGFSAVEQSAAVVHDLDGESYLGVFAREQGYLTFEGNDWRIFFHIPVGDVFAPVDLLRSTIILSLLPILVLVVILAIIFSSFLTRPIRKLTKAAEVIGKGNLNHKVDIKTKDEFGLLARTFNEMTLAIKSSRASVDRKVKIQSRKILSDKEFLESQQSAVLNVLEDVQAAKQISIEAKIRTDAILDGIGDGVFFIDNELKVIMFNPIAEQLSGYTKEEAIGTNYRNVLKFIKGDSSKISNEFIDRAFKTGEIQTMENDTLLVKKDGSKISVSDSAAPLKDADGKIIGCVVVFRDVTKERAIDRAKSEFVSLVSHQLRTPLTAIKWYVETLIEKDGNFRKDQLDHLNEIQMGNKRMINLVNGFLNVSRIELGTLGAEIKKVKIKKVGERVIKNYIQSIKNKKLKVSTKSSKLYDPIIETDERLLGIALDNVLSNAVKYTPVGGKIVLEMKPYKKDSILISIQDSGYGIPKNQQKRIFEKLFRADNIREKDTTGTGLGLYLSKAIVELFGGKIWFESELNKGTKFYILLPNKTSISQKKGKTLIY